MDQVIQMVKERAGIGEDEARTAVETVLAELRKRLPEPIAGQLEGVLDGDGGAKDALGQLGGVLGR